MSFIRKRQRNLIIAGMMGFLIAVLFISGMYVFGIRGNDKVINWILEDSQLEVNTVKEVNDVVDEVLLETMDVYTLLDTVKVGELVQRENLLKMTIESRYVPEHAIINIEQLIGKKALIDLEEKMILTKQMVINENEQIGVLQTAEFRNIHVPNLLKTGDYVNLRIHFPSGQDYLILKNKEVIQIQDEYNGLYMNLTEEEILNYSSALVDLTIFPGTRMYFTKYQVVISDVPMFEGYDPYPLNPNVLELSRNELEEEQVFAKRMQLDISLFEYFDEDTLRYRYGYEELTDEEMALQASYMEATTLVYKTIDEEMDSYTEEHSVEMDFPEEELRVEESDVDAGSEDESRDDVNNDSGF